jgi:PAS domain S-box-containing protein
MKLFSWPYVLRSACLFAAYMVTARLGFHVQATAKVVTEVWAPTGISLAALMFWGPRFWPAIFLGALATNGLCGISWTVSAGIAAGNTLEALMGTLALRRWVRFDPALPRIRDIANLLFYAALFSTLFSASIGVLSLWAGHCLSAGAAFPTWRLWWLGDMVSNLTIAPFLFSWGMNSWKSWKSIPTQRWLEALGVFAAMLVVSLLIFSPIAQIFLPTGRKVYFIFPPLVWAAMRFGTRGVSGGMLLTMGVALACAKLGVGPFVGHSLTESMVNVQVFLGVNSITALVLAAIAQERVQALLALRESEGRFRKAADDAPVMLWMSGTDSRCHYFNGYWLAFTGRPIEQEMNNAWMDGVHPDDLTSYREIYASAFNARESFQMEYRLKRYDGEYRWIADHGTPRFSTANQFEGYIGTCIDIHDRKMGEQALEQKVAQRTSQLAALNRELEAFSYSVSHDLRAPLRAIDGFSQEILANSNAQLDHRARGDLKRVRVATQRMAQLIDDLLNFSHLSRAELKKEKVNLSGLARHIVDQLRQASPERQVEFTSIPQAVVSGDPHLLRIALENLLGNAWKFTQKTADAKIEFGVTQDPGKKVYFVRDNGAGFNMQYAEKLFGVFQRLHTEKEFPGTGIGLATIQRILHRHGGEIWAKAQEGQGATFYFSLP